MKAKVLMTGLFALALMAVGCKSNKENDPKENGTAKISIVVGGTQKCVPMAIKQKKRTSKSLLPSSIRVRCKKLSRKALLVLLK